MEICFHPKRRPRSWNLSTSILISSLSWTYPPSLLKSASSLTKWSEESAEQEIERLQRYIKFDQTKQESDEKKWKRDLFLDPKKRGKWIDLHFKPHRTGPPDFANDGQTNEKTRDPKKVKEIYLKVDTIF